MKDKLLKLHDYLLSNGYIKDADRIYSILEEYENENKLSDPVSYTHLTLPTIA